VDPRLLRAYDEELAYLREAAREFGQEYAVAASHLGLNTPNNPDPHVERLLEGVAFLAARVHLKMHDQFPEFTQHLLQAIQPGYLAPTPSMCIVRFAPEAAAELPAKGVRVPRFTALAAPVRYERTLERFNRPSEAPADTAAVSQVRFQTAHDVDLYPLRIEAAEYLPSRGALGAFRLGAATANAEAGLRIRFAAERGVPLGAIAPALLPLYLAG